MLWRMWANASARCFLAIGLALSSHEDIFGVQGVPAIAAGQAAQQASHRSLQVGKRGSQSRCGLATDPMRSLRAMASVGFRFGRVGDWRRLRLLLFIRCYGGGAYVS